MGKYRWIYIGAALAAAAGYIATDKKQMLVLLVFLVVMFCVSVVFWLFTWKRISYELEVEDVSIKGRDISVKIVLHDSGFLPIGSILMDTEYENFIFSDIQRQTIILKPGGSRRLEYLLPYRSQNCGKTSVRIKRVRIYDLLGIVYHSDKKQKEKEIIIYPDVKNLEIKKVNISNSKNSGEAYDETHKGQDVSEVFDMRDYQQGDSVKSIHWKLSSKLDKLIIREFGNPINYHTALYYDTEIEEGTAKEGMRDLQNGILQMTASMSRSLIQSGFTHHMISFEDLKEMEKLVEDNTSYLQVLAEMMCRKIVGTREQYLAQMDLLLQEKRFTNIIMVCGKLDMSNIHQLSRRAGLTVVYINGNNEDSVEKGENFTIISVPIGKLDKNIQMIEF